MDLYPKWGGPAGLSLSKMWRSVIFSGFVILPGPLFFRILGEI